MLKNYIKVSFRQLLRRKSYSVINVGGLALGMTVTMFIGLWILDELQFNKVHTNYNTIGQVWYGIVNPETQDINGGYGIQYPLGTVLRNDYQHYFKHVIKAQWVSPYTLAAADKKLVKRGQFIESTAPEVFSLKMVQGDYHALETTQSIILSVSTATAMFGAESPLGKLMKVDNRIDLLVTGVYEDLPKNSRFADVVFFASWEAWVTANPRAFKDENDWDNRFLINFVQLQPGVGVEQANAAIHGLYQKYMPADFYKTTEEYKPFPQVIPMSTWHLYSEFENGKPAGGRILFVWLFGIIGIFVLLLACINFVNLSTARSEQRAREVGVRKAIGSSRAQLVAQFLSESFIVVVLAFGVACMLMLLLNTPFNALADKDIALPFSSPLFWTISVAFIAVTGFLAGLYPAFYLSSFRPARVLKGVIRYGNFASLPRQTLVVVQFTTSVILILGTVVIYQQIQFAMNRPIGYDRDGLVSVFLNDPDYKGKETVIRTELIRTGVIADAAFSSSPMTAVWNTTGGYDWKGKDPNTKASFAVVNVTPEFGKTVGWQFTGGRDFSREFATDSTDAIIINEAAARYMGFENAVGQTLTDVNEFGEPKWTKTIIGVIKDVVMDSPYEPVRQTIFFHRTGSAAALHVRIAPETNIGSALAALESVLRTVAPSALFDYKFVDDEYAAKFGQEQKIGRLSAVFAVLAILISIMGLFGLASFVAEQRTKEIGIRKVLGASISNLWRMLSTDFMLLVLMACAVALPAGYFLMSQWLEGFEYRTEISWWVLLVTCLSAFGITLLTVSYQTVKAASMNPVDSLRSE